MSANALAHLDSRLPSKAEAAANASLPASTLVAVTVMHKHEVPLSFAGFVKKALPYALMHLAIAVVYVLFVVPLLA